jgi:thiamine biosynthesis lipoprotein
MWTFRAMGTTITVSAPRVDDADGHAFAERTAALFATVEQQFSRFLPQSELSLLNRAASPVTVSAEMIDLLRRCERHVADTGGLFDPAIGAALVAAGYDRSFSQGALDRDDRVDRVGIAVAARFAELGIDEHARVVARPLHLQLDFGGFLKGRTADRAAAAAPEVALIDAGGDIVLRGAGPDGDGWLVEVEDPSTPDKTVATLRVADRAVATSAPNRRRWRCGATAAHHLIDPRTGLPSRSDLAQVTVLASTAEQADVYAKTAYLLGARDARAFITARPRVAAVWVTTAGSLEVVGDVEVIGA